MLAAVLDMHGVTVSIPVFQAEIVYFLQQLGNLHYAILAAEEEGSLQFCLITESTQQGCKAIIRNLQITHTNESAYHARQTR